MPPCEYFTPFYIQCGVYTEFGIEPIAREYDYAKEISFDDTCDAIQKIMDEIIK